MRTRSLFLLTSGAAALLAVGTTPIGASSHREAPSITRSPKVDGTDFYMFRSYEPGREAFVTFIANYQPLQGPGFGPNYFTMDPDAIYEIHIDNDGDAVEDLTFQFKFTNAFRNGTGVTVTVGEKTLPIALRAGGPVSSANDTNLGETETYTLELITGDRRSGARAPVTNVGDGSATFAKPLDNIGNKTIPDYAAYVAPFVYSVLIPGCGDAGRVFVGQREEAFAVNLGAVFDLVNLVPVDGDSFPGGIQQSRDNDDLIGKYNVTSLAVEVPISCVTGAGNGVIGAWTTASLPRLRVLDRIPSSASLAGQVDDIRSQSSSARQLGGFGASFRKFGASVQVSRLSAPLVNELVIGLPQKDLFNAAEPNGDAALAEFVTNPTFPAILDTLFRAPVNATLGTSFESIAPSNFPRNDLVATFLTGIETLNQQQIITPSEMMRLNTMVPPTLQADQSAFGVVGNDLAGYPNGRRPGDDAVDITLRVAMGRLCHPVPIADTLTDLGLCTPADAPVGTAPFTDGAPIAAVELQNVFPYLNNPIPGAPGHPSRIP